MLLEKAWEIDNTIITYNEVVTEYVRIESELPDYKSDKFKTFLKNYIKNKKQCV
jgi:hypothetical protein